MSVAAPGEAMQLALGPGSVRVARHLEDGAVVFRTAAPKRRTIKIPVGVGNETGYGVGSVQTTGEPMQDFVLASGSSLRGEHKSYCEHC